MRIALAIAPQDAEAASFVVYRDRLDIVIPKAAAMGYDGVELALSSPDDIDVADVAGLLANHQIGISAVSTGRVFSERRAWLTSADPVIRERATRLLCSLVDAASALGAACVNIGRVRGPIPDGEPSAVAEGRFLAGIREVADHAAPLGIDLVIEPVNRYELNYINSVDPEGIGLIRRVAHPNVKLMPDSFHMNIEDVSIAGSILAAGDVVGYCQLADSNRWAPGHGHTDFEPIVAALRAIGYDGWVALEMLPYPSADEAAVQAIRHLRALIPVVAG